MFLKISHNQIFSPCRVTLFFFAITLPWPNYAAQPNFNHGAADTNANTTSSNSNAVNSILHPELFGIIEIGTKGVKSVVVEIGSMERNKNCSEDNTELTQYSIKYSLEPRNTNPVEKASLEDTVKAARKLFDEMTKNLSVDSRQIYLVGGISDINLFPHKDELKKALEQGLPKMEMDWVTPEQEVVWSFHEVLKMIPEPYRAKRKKEVVVLDIGSGYAKGGYLEKYADGKEEIISAVVPWGTQTFTDEINKSNKSQVAFHEVAEKLCQDTLFPIIHDKLSNKLGFVNSTRVYLIGGIAWATSTLVHPNDNGPFPVMNVKDFDTLHNQAISPNAAANLDKVRNAFSPDNIVAGLKILKAFSEEMGFKDKKMFFIRDSLYAWPLGYILDRCKKDNTCCKKLIK
jgi:hypothetical protein